jgi:ribulose-5-phosphate 4-epimerase/fuculose-1-phosphate aldolase
VSPPDERDLRRQALAALQRLDTLGMNRGSTGNLSLRLAQDGQPGMLITPTGMGADELQPDDLVWMGEDGTVRGRWKPSSEWPFHRALYRQRPDLHAVVHTHAVNATALACLERRLPPFHYMVAVAGGDDVPLAGYHTFGTEALSQAVVGAMHARDACLLAHHGLVTAGPTLARAMKVMQEVEALCEVYLKALAVAEPPLLDPAQMSEVIEKFRHYGQPAGHQAGGNLLAPPV